MAVRSAALTGAFVALGACSSPCEGVAVVTDIDGTLTLSNDELVQQLLDPDYDQQAWPDAATLMQAYVAAEYEVIYVTSRGEALTLEDGTPMRDATTSWLTRHGFPDGPVHLAPGAAVFGDDAFEYKAEVLAGLQAAGTTIALAYGNADSDIAAYFEVGLLEASVYAVGPDAEEIGGTPIPIDDTFTGHLADHPPPPACP
jgi:phosphatidate phosphatase PAH1